MRKVLRYVSHNDEPSAYLEDDYDEYYGTGFLFDDGYLLMDYYPRNFDELISVEWGTLAKNEEFLNADFSELSIEKCEIPGPGLCIKGKDCAFFVPCEYLRSEDDEERIHNELKVVLFDTNKTHMATVERDDDNFNTIEVEIPCYDKVQEWTGFSYKEVVNEW